MTPVLSRRGIVRGVLSVSALGAMLALVGCQSTPELVPSDDHAEDIGAVVEIVDNAYVAETVTITAGQAVEWIWAGKGQHDVIADDGSFVSELMSEGSYVHIFDEPGEYPYTCSIHPEMRGTVIVE